MKLDYYENLGNCRVIKQIEISDWFSLIKKSPYSSLIADARNKGNKEEINNLKENIVPCVTFNFHFNKYKLNKNITGGAGYLFIDVDDSDFDINSIDKSKILCYYRSFRLHGFNIIVRVDGLTLSNFNATYLAICNDLGLHVDDKYAKKATQFSVLSFDPNIFINDNPFVFSSINNNDNNLSIYSSNNNLNNSLTKYTAAPTSIVNKGKEEYTIDLGASKYQRTRYNDLDRIPISGDYIVNWEGYDVIGCILPFYQLKDGKYNFLLAYCTNYIYLNSHIDYGKAYITLCNVANIAFEFPMINQENKIHKILKSIFKYKNDGTLRPIINKKKRKIVFQEGLKMTKEEKLDIVRQELAIHRTDQSHQRIIDVINNWNFEQNGEISSRKIIRNSSLSKNTVDKYYKFFYQEITDLNNEYKLNGTVTTSIAA